MGADLQELRADTRAANVPHSRTDTPYRLVSQRPVSGTPQHSNGFLPLAPLRHGDPTVVGTWDLDISSAIARPFDQPSPNARDQLVLARLHRQPVAILHLDHRPGEEHLEDMFEAAWEQGREEILRHIESSSCLPVPVDAHSLREMLSAGGAPCPDRVPPRPPGRAAVIVCTVGDADVLHRALQSLSEMRCEDAEIVVVDNRPSSSGTRDLVESFRSPIPIRYVAESRPGLSNARNAGVAAAAGAAYVAFTDDDVVVDPEWLGWLLAPFAYPDVMAVTGLVMPLSLESAVQKRFEQYAGFGKGVRGESYDMVANRAEDRFLFPYWGGMFGSGNSMAFRHDALGAVGGFDPALGAGTPTGGGEDLAAFTDVILRGGRLAYEPRSVCWHEHRVDEDGLSNQVRNYGIGLTAVFWRYLWRDWRFTATVVRSVPMVMRLLKSRSDDRQVDRLPGDLAKLESRGRLVGPWRYAISRRNARRFRR